MTMNKIFTKLRKNGKANYKQFNFCFLFAVLLIATFISIASNSAVKTVLPPGGDSIKQVYMIFGVAFIGCLVFTIYAGNLFLRYKSKEIGVFLALGTPKKQLARALYQDLLSIISVGIGLGIIIGTILSYIILKIFQLCVSVKINKVSLVSLNGIMVSLLFGCIAGGCILFLAARFMQRTNIIDIINEDRKNEKFKKNIDNKYLLIGVCSLVLGLLVIGVVVPVYVRTSKQILGAWTNLFFIFVIWGIYRIMVYSISIHKRGRNPQNYYNNIIAYGMLKFQGSSIVKNMLVITLLIICSIFACLYTPGQYLTSQKSIREDPVDFSMSYLMDVNGIDQDRIYKLAKENNVVITDYHEINFIRLLGSGINRENVDSNGKLIEEYEQSRYYYACMSVEEYNKLTGSQVELESGHYFLLAKKSMHENIYNKFDDLDYLKNPYTERGMGMIYDGNLDGSKITEQNGFDTFSRYVINNNDYKMLSEGLPDDKLMRSVLFNVEDIENSYPFALELYKIFCQNASNNMLHLTYYDEYQEEVSLSENGYYDYGETILLSPEHPEENPDWKYLPNFKILKIENGFLAFAVFYLLFIVVTIICLAAVGIVSYTRSIAMVVSNLDTFNDIRKLGANEAYLCKVLKKLIRKVYVLPTIIGCVAMLVWYPLMLWQNDGRITSGEMLVILLEVGLCGGICFYQYIFYSASVRKTHKIIG